MANTQINLTDYFKDWRTKTNIISNHIGDITTINLAGNDKTSIVTAINKTITNSGDLTTLTTTTKSSLVGAINEIDDQVDTIADNIDDVNDLLTTEKIVVPAINEIYEKTGNLASLLTTEQTSLVGAINEIVDKFLVMNATITVDTQNNDTINVAVQCKNYSNANPSSEISISVYLSDDTDGSSLIAATHSGGWSIGTNGLLLPIIENKMARIITNDSGAFDIDIVESGSKTSYLVLILPLGNIIISDEITHV